jgi:serine/threonine-protein kinase
MMSEAIEIGDRPHAVCWAEEYLDGQDVGGLLGEKWNDADTVRMLHDIALGLKACHDLDVVHRDISPGNVRCCTDGRFVLMDPGFARHLAKTALTGEFQPGTPGFRSPEHVPGGEPTPASDIFGLGVLAFLARSSILPVDYNGDDDDYYRRLTEMQSPSLRSMCPDASNALVGIVDRCLQRQPARRYLDGSELLTGVESALSSGTDG